MNYCLKNENKIDIILNLKDEKRNLSNLKFQDKILSYSEFHKGSFSYLINKLRVLLYINVSEA